jgi:hypothetical protein
MLENQDNQEKKDTQDKTVSQAKPELMDDQVRN